MRNGTVLGVICGLLASGILIGSVSLMEPRSEPSIPAASDAAPLEQPEQGETRNPQALDRADRRLSVPEEPDVGASFGAAPVGRVEDRDQGDGSAGPLAANGPAAADLKEAPTDARDAVALPGASEFNRPPEDRAVAPPTAASAPNATPAAQAPAVPGASPEAPRAQTRSGAAPRAGEVTGFAGDPALEPAPTVPTDATETAPRPMAEARVSVPEAEPAASMDKRPPARDNGAPVTLVPRE
ncbi:hypothetical protein [uncultured Jannaschia sp.]|uniref:hypothetical protein n=1 Tax=uncultured Jannaschia sp. TaxID=293347 RepID=UPI002604B49A|nr:hypothetical protein [uncultured Jannaschia sp.]